MNKIIHYSIMTLLISAVVSACGESNEKNKILKAPIAKKIPHSLTTQGETRIDNYYWMRDDSRTDPEVINHLNKENTYTNKTLAHTKPLQNTLYQEMAERINEDDKSVPYKKGEYWYYWYYLDGSDYPIYARKKHTLEAKEEIYLDQNKRAEGKSYFYVADHAFSSNNKLLAWTEDTLGRNIYTIHIKNTETGEMLSDQLTGASYNIMWANDNKSLFYINKNPQTLLGYQVFRHTLGTNQKDDTLVYEEQDNGYYTDIYKSEDDSTLVIIHESTKTVATSILDANKPTEAFKRLTPLEDNHRYYIQPYNEWIYILSNGNNKDYELYRVNRNAIGNKANWQLIIPNKPGHFIEDSLVKNQTIISHERINGENSIKLYSLDGKPLRDINFPDKANYLGLSGLKSSGDTKFRYTYSTLKTPEKTYEFDLSTQETALLKEEKAGAKFNGSKYTTERIFISARDNTKIPVSLIYKTDTFKKDGSNPLLQYAYGSYGSNITPYFRQKIFSLLDRGFVYAIAHIRGSSFLGFHWYEDGKMLNKINTFTDFIDTTDALVQLGYGDKKAVFAQGGSAGGLLMGAVSNMASEKYKGIIAEVPFVDVITTMEDHSIPLTTGELHEWGDPTIKEQYDYMMSYSPYDQVEAKEYTNMFVTTGFHDSQVQYFEPMKWVAKLRELKTDNNLLLFRTDMEAGHGGSSGRYKALEETAIEYAFMLGLVGIKQ